MKPHAKRPLATGLVKTLADAETRNEKWAAGATESSKADIEGYLAVFAAKQIMMGLKKRTVNGRISCFRFCKNVAQTFSILNRFSKP